MGQNRYGEAMDGVNRNRVSTLRIRLLGNLEVSDAESSYGPPSTRKARSLLAYLLIARGRLHSRDALAGEFWGDMPQDRARQSLRTTLWRIRRGLGESEGRSSVLVTEGEYVGIEASSLWLDVYEFEARLEASLAPGLSADGAARSRRDAIMIYRGPLLEECYDDWCLRERERLRERYAHALERQLQFEESRGEWEAAIRLGEELLHLDPLRESVHRDLMRCHFLAGNRAAALQQYHRCERELERELGVGPMEATSRLHDEILGRGGADPFVLGTTFEEAGTMLSLERARRLLEQTNATLSRLHCMTAELERARAHLHERIDGESIAVTVR